MATVSIFHNISRDASFGLNTVFRTGDTRPAGVVNVIELADGRFTWKDAATLPEERHELAWVFQYDAGGCDDAHALLEAAFETFNIGEDELAGQYRARKLRSLSVGDVVMIDGTVYSCESAGWAERNTTDLRILPAADAEKVIRERYQFKPSEALSVTVPLAD